MSTHVVEDPSGRTWRVGVPLLPWRPRWRGLAPWRRRAWQVDGHGDARRHAEAVAPALRSGNPLPAPPGERHGT